MVIKQGFEQDKFKKSADVAKTAINQDMSGELINKSV
jgi:hypothetical protein